MNLTIIKEEAEKRGLSLDKLTDYHYQIKGIFTLNLYPTKGTVYINGMTEAVKWRSRSSFLDLAEIGKLRPGRKVRFSGVKRDKRLSFNVGRSCRRKLWEAGVNSCFVCGEIMEESEISLEHKIPLFLGGSNRMDNLSLSHRKCNEDKGHKL